MMTKARIFSAMLFLQISSILLPPLFILAAQKTWADADLEALLGGGEKSEKTVKTFNNDLVQWIEDVLQSQKLKPSAEQNVFFRYLENSQWSQALIQYQPAFGGTTFEKTQNGKALQAYVKFKANLSVLAIEEIFLNLNPSEIHPKMVEFFKEMAPSNHPVWQVAMIQWKPTWTQVFGKEIELKVRTKLVTPELGIENLQALSKEISEKSSEWVLVNWNLSLAYALNDQADKAAKIISSLLKNEDTTLSKDLLNLTAGRLLYQNGYFEPAAKYYEKITKGSDYWLEAQEELAWTFVRKGEPQNSLAVTRTLVNPIFKSEVGPETYFVKALSELRVCDYGAVIDDLRVFSKEFKIKALDLQKASEAPEIKSNFIQTKMKKDIQLSRLNKSLILLNLEAQVAESIYANSLAQTGLQGIFETYKKDMKERTQKASVALLNRGQELAKSDLVEVKKILDKMHILEAEVIQQISVADRIINATSDSPSQIKLGSTGSKAVDVLKFASNEEVWFDELSNFRVNVKKGCQKK